MAKPVKKRYRFAVSEADTSTNDWIEAQANISTSIWMLIADAIERDGYTDVTCRRKEQLPRRGRPPKDDLGSLQSDRQDFQLTSDQTVVNDEHSVSTNISPQNPLGTASISNAVQTELPQQAPVVSQQPSVAVPQPVQPQPDVAGQQTVVNTQASDLLGSLL